MSRVWVCGCVDDVHAAAIRLALAGLVAELQLAVETAVSPVGLPPLSAPESVSIGPWTSSTVRRARGTGRAYRPGTAGPADHTGLARSCRSCRSSRVRRPDRAARSTRRACSGGSAPRT